ncbi:molybdate ABC transporter substrate-binding protein [Dehalobacterium formicoaceticum]|uniref:Molybdate ABC transporter substrate-binding protein n=1 Tax=Dehalobacterium formicoaceticum TaxID=51515 RepID=A0ABT1Y2V6_9FIRM|nr:molybdate ABC transporter substrate-binding protein [Dehalobacterium formicoaceticum]MCR6545209.1 molybdate ABC transporter substrate-binding protein [Dehalobacterium formicoaceticum]
MKKMSLLLVFLMMFALVLTGCGNENGTSDAEGPTDEAVEINISAAASLTDALTEIQAEYAKKSNAILQFNFAASGTLQKQIQEGAPCDLFISASKGHMDTLEGDGLVVTDSRKDLLGNTLTLIATAEKADLITGPESFTNDDVASIAIGEPESVPAGNYSKQTFESLGIWDQIQEKLVFAKDVRQVLQYVDSGNADCGLVYRSDAMLLETGKIIVDMPADSHDPIVYPAAIMKNAAQPEAANAFYEFLQTDYAKKTFEKYGFQVL